jgi:hypothetical protein
MLVYTRAQISQWFARFPWFRALRQSNREVTVRKPGCRFLSAPGPVTPYAAQDWEFACLAAAAYGKTPAAERRRQRTVDAEERFDPELPLRNAGWQPWDGFPDPELHKHIQQSHLRVEVWEKTLPGDSSIVAVTFGGTVFNNKKDWRANLRWFLPGGKGDEYTDVVRKFAPAFVKEFPRRMAGRSPRTVELVATGHSLGGGLAQQFAYAHCLDDQVPRVTRVYAFDPSPVTGFFSVKRSVRNVNRKALRINRIYERGEILAIVRSIMSVLWKPSERAPEIRGTRYFLFFAWNPIVGHSMVRMAARMKAASGPDLNGVRLQQ